MTVCPVGTNSASITEAPMLACQGNPFVPLRATSRAQLVSRLMSPSATIWPLSTAIRLVCPTPWAGLWSRRMGRAWLPIPMPCRSTTTGCGNPAIRISPPV